MTIIGHADLLVSPKLAPNFNALLKSEVSAASSVGASAIPVPVKPQVDPTSVANARKSFGALGTDASAAFTKSFKGGITTATPEMMAAFRKGGKGGLEDFLGIGANAKAQAAEAVKAAKEVEAIKAGIARTSLTTAGIGIQTSTIGARAEQDIAKAKKNIGALGAEIEKAGAAGGGAAGGMAGLAAGFGEVGAAAGGAAVVIGVAAVAVLDFAKAAGQLQQAEANVNTVFGDSGKIVTDFANDASRNLLQSKAAADQAAVAFGELFVGLDIGQKQAADMSVALVGLAQDIATLRQLPVKDVERLLTAGIAGNPRAFKQLGQNINDVDIKARGLADGITHGTEALATGAKTIITYNEAVEKFSNASGVAAASQDHFLTAQQKFSKAIEDAKADIGTGLLPELTKLVNELSGLAHFVDRNAKKFSDFFSGFFKGVVAGLPGGSIIAPILGLGIAHETAAAKADVNAAANKKAAAAIKAAGTEAERTATALRIQNESPEHLTAVTALFAAAQRQGPDEIAVRNARRDIERATIGVRTAENNLTDARKEALRLPNQIKEAELGLARARLSAESAALAQRKTALETADILSGQDRKDRLEDLQLRAAEATLSLDKALQAEKKSLLDIKSAQNDLLHAQFEFIGVSRDRHRGILALGDATLKVAKAEQAIADAKLGARGDPLTLARAQIDVRKIGIEQSRFGAEQSIREAEAQIQVSEADLAVQSAALGVISATNSLQDLRDKQIRQADIVRLAEIDLGKAQDGVTSAVYASAAAVAQLKEDMDILAGDKGPAALLQSKYAAFVGEMNAHSDLLKTGTIDVINSIGPAINSALDAVAKSGSASGSASLGSAGAKVGGTTAIDHSFKAALDRFVRGMLTGPLGLLLGIDLNPFRAGGNVIPGAQFGATFNARSKLIHVGESGDEILKITPGGRADIIPHGRTASSPATIGEVHIHEAASPEATMRAIEWRIGMESQR